MIGIRKLAKALKELKGIPEELVRAVEAMAENDVFSELISDACKGVRLFLDVPSVFVRLKVFGRSIIEVDSKPFQVQLHGDPNRALPEVDVRVVGGGG